MKKRKLSRRGKPRSFEEKFARDGAFFGSREGKAPRPFGKLARFMLISLGGVLLFLAAYLLAGLWRVTEVTTHEGELYSAAVVLEHAELEVGDGMLGFDARAVARRLKERMPLLDSVKIRRRLNGCVSITFTEETNVYYTRHNGNYYMISAATREVLCVDPHPAEAIRVGAVYLGLPESTRVRVGEELSFINLPYEPDSKGQELSTYELETDEPAVEYAYVFEFEETLMASPLRERVTGMELGDRYELRFVLDGRVLVRVGSMAELERKLTVARDALERELQKGGIPEDMPILVDVTDPTHTSIRPSPGVELPDWAAGRLG